MGHIKEPDGIDFVINSRPLTKDEEIAISKYIHDYKVKNANKRVTTKQKGNTSVRKKVEV